MTGCSFENKDFDLAILDSNDIVLNSPRFLDHRLKGNQKREFETGAHSGGFRVTSQSVACIKSSQSVVSKQGMNCEPEGWCTMKSS